MNSCIPSGNLAKKDCCDDEDGNLSVTSYTSTITFYNVSKSVVYGLQSHKNPSSTEIILVMWVITLVCEELRQLFVIRAPSARNAVAIYFKSYWNKLDVVAIILFFRGTSNMFTTVKLLGPKLVIIDKM
ncbi:unnamed protein product, partial [Rotaria sordida]